MTTTMYDAVTVENIPHDAEYVAGYVGGRWVTYPVLLKKFPNAKHVLSIAVASTQDAECVDRETGDVPAELVPGWVKRQHARGIKRPVVYGSISDMPNIIRALSAAGIKRAEYRVWAAHYTGKPHICGPHTCGFATQADATQWFNNALGRSLDVSLMGDSFWEPAQWPTPRLRQGMSGHDVRRAQRLLNEVRSIRVRRISEDGVFGARTRKRVNQYKRRNGLKPDGVVGHRMGRKLIAEAASKRRKLPRWVP